MGIEFHEYDVYLESEELEDYRRPLAAFALVEVGAAAMHIHAAQYINAGVSGVFSALMIVLLTRPTWLGLVGMMTFSLTQCCTSALLLGAGLLYDKVIWSHDLLANMGLAAYFLDFVVAAASFIILNAVWAAPSKGLSGYEEEEDDEPGMYEENEHDDIWAPFAGAGKSISDFEVRDKDLENPA